MRHITISTTGMFNAIRPSLFPPIEGKETTTFLLGLDFHTAELYKRNLQTLIDEEYKFGWAGTVLGYPWNASDYSIMAQINESLGKLDLAKEQYDKAYALVS